MKKFVLNAAIALFFGISGAWIFTALRPSDTPHSSVALDELKGILASYHGQGADGSLSFVLASKVSTPAVVFIKTSATVQQRSPFGMFFDGWDPFGSIGKVSSSGSGVIVRPDGYIVSNLHVVKDAQTIEVVLNKPKRTYTARVIGTDPSTDLALLKIEAGNLPAIAMANSDDLQVGEWVVAVGNPFNLTSTVTAGIVSAKGRNINVVNNQFPIESFIQTDAAINPGNSGGALVNLSGELVGINTAIFSQTGSYAGYGFAIPSNIVAKTVKDLIDFGQIQRGYSGIEAAEMDESAQKKNKLSEGAQVSMLYDGSPAAKAGLQKGDIIVRIQNRNIEGKSVFDEHMSYYRPGDKISLSYVRNGKQYDATLVLTNQDGETSLESNSFIHSDKLGADFGPVTAVDKQKLGIGNGVKVKNIGRGLIGSMNIEDGFIFLKFNGKTCSDPEELIRAMENSGGRFQIEGLGADGGKRIYNFW